MELAAASIHVLHDCGARSRARVQGWSALGGSLGSSSLLGLLVTTLLQQAHRKILRRVTNKVELSQHQLDLLDELTCTWGLPKLDGLDVGRLILTAKNVSSLDFENIVTESNQVRYSVIFHVSTCLKESLNFPLLVVAWVQFLVLGAS